MEIVDKPWGYTQVVTEGMGYKVKLLVFYPGKRTSLQSHAHRQEYMQILKGDAEIERKFEIDPFLPPNIFLQSRETAWVPTNILHRITNVSVSLQLVILETQFGEVLSEDDIIRYEDDFGRV